MADQQYDLFFSGQLLDGHFEDFVKGDLKRLFKANDQYVDQLFSGSEQVVKKKVDKATAIKFQKAFKTAGAKLIVRAHNAEALQPATPAKTSTSEATTPAPTPSTEAKPLATAAQAPKNSAPGSTPHFATTNSAVDGENSDDLIEHHQPPIEGPDSVPNWDLSAPGVQLVAETPFVPANIETSSLSVAAAGESLTTSEFEEPAPVINTDQISLAEPGGDIENLDKRPEPIAVNTSHLSIES